MLMANDVVQCANKFESKPYNMIPNENTMMTLNNYPPPSINN